MSKASVTAAGFVAEYKSAFPEALCASTAIEGSCGRSTPVSSVDLCSW